MTQLVVVKSYDPYMTLATFYGQDVAQNRMERISGMPIEFWSEAVQWSTSYRYPLVNIKTRSISIDFASLAEFQAAVKIYDVAPETEPILRKIFDDKTFYDVDVLDHVFWMCIQWESEQREKDKNASNEKFS